MHKASELAANSQCSAGIDPGEERVNSEWCFPSVPPHPANQHRGKWSFLPAVRPLDLKPSFGLWLQFEGYIKLVFERLSRAK